MSRSFEIAGAAWLAAMLSVVVAAGCSSVRTPLHVGDAGDAREVTGPDQSESAQPGGDAREADARVPSLECIAQFSATLRQGLSSVGYSGRCGTSASSANSMTFDEQGGIVKLDLVDTHPVYDALRRWVDSSAGQSVLPCLATQTLRFSCASFLGG